MEISREDLLKQKATLEQQLQWVNRMLAESEGSDQPAGAASPPEAATSTETRPAPAGTPPPSVGTPSAYGDPGQDFEAANRRLQHAPPQAAAPGGASSGLTDFMPPVTEPSSAGSFSTAQKLGCAAVAAGVCLGILFALFVLPYLLY